MAGGESWPAVLAVVLTCVVTVAVGAVGLRLSRTTGDFYVASRAVGPRWNASAIGGEYLSAASFLGVAGLVLTYGSDMLWYPIGYTAGYIVLLVLVAAPLRRSGAYTLPDFAEIRLGSLTVRRIASVLVVGIGWLYLLPQFQGAGLALRTVTGAPRWVGAALVAVVVLLNVVAGGMRSITFVQAFQYWLKLTAIGVPVVFLLLAWSADGAPDLAAPGPTVARQTTTVTLQDAVRVTVESPVTIGVDGRMQGLAASSDPGSPQDSPHGVVSLDGPVHATLRLPAGDVTFAAGTTITLPAGTPVPTIVGVDASDGPDWARPSSGAGGRDHPLYRTYSLLLALLFGTMGLPHVLVRFYTNPDGRAARRTTLVVIGLLGAFYLFPPVYGALGRVYAPELLMSGRTDAVVLLLPRLMLPAPWGDLVAALLIAGAFAAFLSTASGLTVSVAGVLSQDLLRGRARASVPGFRAAAALAVVVPALLSLPAIRIGLADTVGLTFALAASTFCPLLALGIWWRGLNVAGATAGLLTGGLLASTAVIVTMAGGSSRGLFGALIAQPALWSVPVAFTVMVLVSLATGRRRPNPIVRRVMVRLHTPEGVEVDRG